MSWEWEIAMGIVAILLLVIAGRMSDAVNGLNGIARLLGNGVDALKEQAKVLEQQNYRLENIASVIYSPRVYAPPSVCFCDRCRKEYPESNRWWTAYRSMFGSSVVGLRLCAYPQQKEGPGDKWLHGEECVLAEMRAYMANARLRPFRQKREYTEYDDFGHAHTRSLDVSHCGHCGKEYSESDVWWTLSLKAMEVEIHEGFIQHGYYFSGEECVAEAVKLFIAAQRVNELPQEWDKYWAGAHRINFLAQAQVQERAAQAAALPHEKVSGGKEPTRHSIPRAVGRALRRLLHRIDA